MLTCRGIQSHHVVKLREVHTTPGHFYPITIVKAAGIHLCTFYLNINHNFLKYPLHVSQFIWWVITELSSGRVSSHENVKVASLVSQLCSDSLYLESEDLNSLYCMMLRACTPGNDDVLLVYSHAETWNDPYLDLGGRGDEGSDSSGVEGFQGIE